MHFFARFYFTHTTHAACGVGGVYNILFVIMGRSDKKTKGTSSSSTSSKRKPSGGTKASKSNRKYSLVHSEGRRASKARVHITSAQKGADDLNVAFMESVRDRLQLMALSRLRASGRVQITAADVYACARDLRGMPQFV